MNTNKGFLLSTLIFILSACDPSSSPWLAGVPIKVTVDQSLPAQFDKKVVKLCPNFLEAFKNEDPTRLQLIVLVCPRYRRWL